MNKSKGFIYVLLLILSAAFITFVVIMQHNFMNPEFTGKGDAQTRNASNQEAALHNEEKAEDTDADTESNSTEKDNVNENNEDESEEITHSVRTVNVDLLNVRSGPGTEYDIAGMVTIDQKVDVEDDGSEWVKIITDDFTGYVNEKYLTAVE